MSDSSNAAPPPPLRDPSAPCHHFRDSSHAKWGVASVGRNAYQSIYMTLEPWADAVRRHMAAFKRKRRAQCLQILKFTPRPQGVI